MKSQKSHNKTAPPLIVVVGETAAGKTGLGIELAKKFNGEIICADSWTVRQEVNIGTAKPTIQERAQVPHHLLDIVGPDEDFTAAVFKELAVREIDRIHRKGKVPIMVGGTGLYIDGVVYDYGFLERGDRTLRAEFDDKSVEEILALLKKEKIELGDVDVRNKRRLIRLYETRGMKPTRAEMRPNTLILGIKTDREVISKRIVERVDAMLEAGLEDEVQSILKRYGWGCEALKGVGYSQWKDYFLGNQTIEETRERIIKSTLDLAKRQRTWFKRNKSIHWFSAPVNLEEAEDLVTTFLNS